MSSDMIKRLSYAEFLNELKERIRTAQTKAVLSINKELISLYWDIGRRIVESQEKGVWGKGVVEKLAGDLRRWVSGCERFFCQKPVGHATILSGV
jgi:hypothetical protein